MALREREHVVVRRVAVGKIDDGADHDRQHVRHERLVALIHHGAAGLALFEGAARRGFEIDDAAAQVRQIARAGAARLGDVGPALRRPRQSSNVEPAADGAGRTASCVRASRRLRDERPTRSAPATRSERTARRRTRSQSVRIRTNTPPARAERVAADAAAVAQVALPRCLDHDVAHHRIADADFEPRDWRFPRLQAGRRRQLG